MTGLEALQKLDRLLARLPEYSQDGHGDGDQHFAFSVRKKNFAWFLDDHHGDGRLALHVKAAPGRRDALVDEDPERFFVPPYVGHRGWVGVWLDVPGVDWDRVEELLVDAYRLTAPKRLVAQLD